MKTHPKLPLPLDVQIERHSNRYALAAFVAGVCVGAILTAAAWCWMTWGFRQ